jgi:hypothetical protein
VIYDFPSPAEPIRQGDIFYPLPAPVLRLREVGSVSETGVIKVVNWIDLEPAEGTVIQVPVEPSWAIAASQDCDAARAPVISMFCIDLFERVTGLTSPKTPKKWVHMITKRSRQNARWFYLPEDKGLGFEERMAVDFERMLQVVRRDLVKDLWLLRKGRLNDVALEHYRESIAYYFRRYPYDEWYPLAKEEFEAYNAEKGPVDPFDWQS